MAMWRTNLHFDWKIVHDSSRALLAEVMNKRPDFAGLETGLSNQAMRHLKKCINKKDERTSAALNAALGEVWHEVTAHKAFAVGETCVRCQEEPEDALRMVATFLCSRVEMEQHQQQQILPATSASTSPRQLRPPPPAQAQSERPLHCARHTASTCRLCT
eukprot:3881978-Amphidinium_carterae.1